MDKYTPEQIAEKNRLNEKAIKRQEAVKLATPQWLSEKEREVLKMFYTVVSNINAEYKKDMRFQVDHIYPIQHTHVCGLHVPWNMQIIDAKENQKKGNDIRVAEIPGAITYDDIVNFMMDGTKPRYKGRFLKGFSGNENGRPSNINKALKKSYDPDREFKQTVSQLREEVSDDPNEFFRKGVETLMMNAESKQELFMYLKEFGQYYQPKLASKDAETRVEDNEITINLGGLEQLIGQAGKEKLDNDDDN